MNEPHKFYGNTITINNKNYNLVKIREYTPVSVYKGEGSYLRIGPQDILEPELHFHENLIHYGFPVANIIEQGKIGKNFYYAETSLGDQILTEVFQEDFEKYGQISEKNFEIILEISSKFAEAQLKTSQENKNSESFYFGVRIDIIQNEFPHLKEKTLNAFEKVNRNLTSLPYVLTHGDFNSHNFVGNGVIDFESSFRAPLGYDLVTGVGHVYFFPMYGDYEMKRKYEFSHEQINKYFENLDKIFISKGLKKLSNFIDDFIFCRNVYATVRMGKTPKIQKWRYEKFEQILNDYLENKPIFEKLIH